jgi:hypothetical protein
MASASIMGTSPVYMLARVPDDEATADRRRLAMLYGYPRA